MRKFFMVACVIISVLFAAYLWAWSDLYITTGKFYSYGLEMCSRENYIPAIKGKFVSRSDGRGDCFQGGFQQVVAAWDNPWAFPKPSIYYEASEEIDEIIKNKIDIETGLSIFKSNIGYDNLYLPEIMLKVGDLYMQKGEIEKALEAYNTVKEAFSQNTEAVKEAENRLRLQETGKD